MDFYDNDERAYIEPHQEIEFYRAACPLPSKLIYSPFIHPELPQKLKKVKEQPRLYQGTHLYNIDDKITYFQGLLGAPATAIFLEELIALGIKEIIFLGLAGAIQTVSIGDRIIVTEAERLEGTSHHYLPASTPCVPSKELTSNMEAFFSSNRIPFTKGKITSIDAPFRETFNLIEQLRGKKVLAVEMEVAAAFAVATFRKVKLAALVVISDELKTDRWSGFQPDLFSVSFRSSFDCILNFLLH